MANDTRVINTLSLTGSFEANTTKIQEMVSSAENLGVGIRIEMKPTEDVEWVVEILAPEGVPEAKRQRKPRADAGQPRPRMPVMPLPDGADALSSP